MQKQQAEKILTQYGLLEWLTDNVGNAHVVGNYVVDLMVSNRLEIYVDNSDMSLEKLYRVTQFVMHTFAPITYEARETHGNTNEKVWFFTFGFMLDDAWWDVELQFVSQDKIKQTEDACLAICKEIALHPQYREIILERQKLAYDECNYCDDDDCYDDYISYPKLNIDGIYNFIQKLNNGNVRRYAIVVFKGPGWRYTYLCENHEIEVGDVVNAPTHKYTQYSPALVMDIRYLAEDELPVAKERILEIDQILSKQDCDFIFDEVGFIRNKIDHKLLKEWTFLGDNDWCKSYGSTFDGYVTYEEDGTLTLGYGLWKNGEHEGFETYTIIDDDDIDIKIDFAKTIISKLYYQQITEDDVKELLQRM